MYNTAWIRTYSRTVPRDKWNPLTTKTSCFGINSRDTYFFDHRDAKSSNFYWKCVEGLPRARCFSRYRAKCKLNGWIRSTAISCWKDVLALMHTVQGKIVNRITRNVVGTHDEFSCSFYVREEDLLVLQGSFRRMPRYILTDIFRISIVAGLNLSPIRWLFNATHLMTYTTDYFRTKRNCKINW